MQHRLYRVRRVAGWMGLVISVGCAQEVDATITRTLSVIQPLEIKFSAPLLEKISRTPIIGSMPEHSIITNIIVTPDSVPSDWQDLPGLEARLGFRRAIGWQVSHAPYRTWVRTYPPCYVCAAARVFTEWTPVDASEYTYASSECAFADNDEPSDDTPLQILIDTEAPQKIGEVQVE